MKRLADKKGFTLVECVVAMAVLAVMTLGLMMILGVTVRTRNANIEMERDIDKQAEAIVNGEGVVTEGQEIVIAFEDGSKNKAGSIVAVKEYYEDDASDVEIGRLKVDSDNAVYDDGDDDDDYYYNNDYTPGTVTPQSGNSKVYGASVISGNTVHIEEYSAGTDKTGDVYTVAWNVTFTAKEPIVEERGVKIIFPEGSSGFSYDKDLSSNCDALKIAKTTLRIAPKAEGDVTVIFYFNISSRDYAANLETVQKYFFNVGNGSAADIEMNAEYDEYGQKVPSKT